MWVVSPAFGRQHAVGRTREIAIQIFNDWTTVDGIGQSLSHANILENRISAVEREIRQHRARTMFDLQIAIVFQGEHHIEAKRVNRYISAAFAQLKSPRRGIWCNSEANPFNAYLLTPVVVIAFDDDLLIWLSTHKTEGARTNWLARDLSECPIRNDADSAIR